MTVTTTTLARRNALRWAAALAAPAFIRDLRAQARLRATPAQTEGPFYPVELPADSDFDLLVQGPVSYAHGVPTRLEGTVRDTSGRELRDAVVEIWQCDHQGHYRHPGDGGRADLAFQGFGRVVADAGGAWRFRTIRPVAYAGRTPHIHFKVRLGTRDLLTTQLYVEGDPGNPRDGIWRRLAPADQAAVTVPFASDGPGATRARFDIVVAA